MDERGATVIGVSVLLCRRCVSRVPVQRHEVTVDQRVECGGSEPEQLSKSDAKFDAVQQPQALPVAYPPRSSMRLSRGASEGHVKQGAACSLPGATGGWHGGGRGAATDT